MILYDADGNAIAYPDKDSPLNDLLNLDEKAQLGEIDFDKVREGLIAKLNPRGLRMEWIEDELRPILWTPWITKR